MKPNWKLIHFETTDINPVPNPGFATAMVPILQVFNRLMTPWKCQRVLLAFSVTKCSVIFSVSYRYCLAIFYSHHCSDQEHRRFPHRTLGICYQVSFIGQTPFVNAQASNIIKDNGISVFISYINTKPVSRNYRTKQQHKYHTMKWSEDYYTNNAVQIINHFSDSNKIQYENWCWLLKAVAVNRVNHNQQRQCS